MKPREPRRKVIIGARMRGSGGWTHVHIHNISSRGLMVQSASALAAGSYVEIRRGSHVIVARVMWVEQKRAGLRAQDALPVNDIVTETPGKPTAAVRDDGQPERRQCERGTAAALAAREQRSRRLGRAVEFAVISALAAGFAVAIAGSLHQSLSRTLAPVEASLGGG